jgi:hypothetical protein
MYDLVTIARKRAPKFQNGLARTCPFEIKGILNSEMLFFVSLAEEMGVRRIIESGRARGQSTEVIARYFGGEISFDSIERARNSPDVAVAEARLRELPVNLHYGRAHQVISKILDDRPTAILLDGPKGLDALRLAVTLFARPNIRFVALHDASKNAQPTRALIEQFVPQFYASDDVRFCEEFEQLDTPCWAEHQKYDRYRGWGPYKRDSEVRLSYGPTLVCMVNEFTDEGLKAFALALASHDRSRRKWLPGPVRLLLKRWKQRKLHGAA